MNNIERAKTKVLNVEVEDARLVRFTIGATAEGAGFGCEVNATTEGYEAWAVEVAKLGMRSEIHRRFPITQKGVPVYEYEVFVYVD